MSIRKVAVALLMAASLGVAPIAALAGSNGQQEEPLTDLGGTSVCVDGTNQNGTHVSGCWSLTAYAYNRINGWWWVGWTDNGFNNSGRWVYVPSSSSTNYWCFHQSSSGTEGWAC
jgi:hypothetical protein